jgi:nucleotide-binding universal stress UspA family protein
VDSAAQLLYTPPTNGVWEFAGSDSQGVLLAVDVSRSVRLVSASSTGSPEVLLDETTYQPTWGFDWRDAVALRRSDGVDVLVSDRYSVVLVHRQGSKVSVITLAESDNADLTAMALTVGSSGTLAMFGSGKDQPGAPEAVIAVDVDPFLAMVNPYPSIAKQINAMPQAGRTFTPTAGANAVATPTAIWLTTERLDPATDCHDTGKTALCGGGNPSVSLLDCTWYVDVFRLTKGADLQAAALATVTGRAYVQPECGATRPVDPHDIMNNLGMGWGMSNNHGTGVDLVTSQLGVVLNHQTSPTTLGLQFALVDPSGHLSIDGLKYLFPDPTFSIGNASAWTGARSGHVFYCAGELPGYCWMADAAAVSTFALDVGNYWGNVRLPDGFGLVESMNNPDTSAWLQPLTCVH